MAHKTQHFGTVHLKALFIVPLFFAAAPALCMRSALPVEKAKEQTVYADVLIDNVPHVEQSPDFCGEACAEMFLRKLGSDIDQNDVFNQSGVDPLEGRGCHTAELAKALKTIGFQVGEVWYKVAAEKADEQIQQQFAALHADLAQGMPSIVCMHYDNTPRAAEHFRLVLGYDLKADVVIYHEPATANGAYQRIKRAQFLKLWPLKYEKKRWTLIRLRLEPDKIRKLKRRPGFTSADYAQHIRELKQNIPNANFTVILQRPFVVIGDESPQMVRHRAIRTIKWSADKLKQDYFKKDPADIIDIWLFKDKKSYKKHAWEIFGDSPSTPFGYFSHEHNALIMNIATGGGTLVHEIVHPFVSSNFPDCPAWFNEGLASLYEQCQEQNGRIRGLTNWRLADLQKDIRAGRLGSFEELTATTETEFYAGSNYAQARYLCYYLQEKGLLVKFYHEFYANRKNDPTGFETLKKVLAETDMDAFQKRWQDFVLKLTFP